MTPRQPYAAVETIYTAETRQSMPMATCMSCEWYSGPHHSLGWPALRARARRHARTHRHAVWSGVRTDYLYAPRMPAMGGRS